MILAFLLGFVCGAASLLAYSCVVVAAKADRRNG